MQHTPDITLIGAGIIGLLTAKELVNSGFKVTVIDKSVMGTESSWAGGGILLPLYPWRQSSAISKLVVNSIHQYPQLAKQLHNDTGIDPEWLKSGLLISKNPDYSAAISWCQVHQINFEDASPNTFSGLNSNTEQPLWLPDIGQIRNPRLLKSLHCYLKKRQVTFIENCEINRCSVQNGQINRIYSDQQSFPVHHLVVNAGAWSSPLLSKLLPNSRPPEILPVKGQMLLFDALPDTLTKIVLDEGHYLIPRKDGKILVGSSVEHADYDKSTTVEIKDKLYQFAIQLCPNLKAFQSFNTGQASGLAHLMECPI